jgi:hypothetical protein
MSDFRKHYIYKHSNQTFPYLVDIQNTYYNALGTRIVVPLQTADSLRGRPSDEAFPAIEVNGVTHYLITTEMAAIPHIGLKFEREATREEIEKVSRAVDRVLGGY